MHELVVATRNPHKLREIQDLLGPTFRCIPLGAFPDAPPLIEEGSTFAENATRKAVQMAAWLAQHNRLEPRTPTSDWLVLADDSGLEVEALNGAPGVHSARFAALDTGTSSNSSDAENNSKLLHLLKDLPPERRGARFRCALALTPMVTATVPRSSPVCHANEWELQTELFEGVCEGRIGLAPQGQGGFGYDPLFVPTGFQHSFAELGEEIKNRLSHRSQALAKLRKWLISKS
jgi:XTP/dITP diphosphohydrolase